MFSLKLKHRKVLDRYKRIRLKLDGLSLKEVKFYFDHYGDASQTPTSNLNYNYDKYVVDNFIDRVSSTSQSPQVPPTIDSTL